MLPTGRSWWDVVGWLAFAVALGMECVALFRGEPLSDASGWIPLALYLLWMVSPILSGRARRLRERMEPRDVPLPRWQGAIGLLALVAVAIVLVTHLEHLHEYVGVPFGVVLGAIALIGLLLRPWVLGLYGKQLRPEGAPPRSEPPKRTNRAADESTFSGKQKVMLATCAIVLFVVYQGVIKPRPPRIEGEEAAAVSAEFETLQQSGFELGGSLKIRAMRLEKSPDADPTVVKALDERSKLAYAAGAAAFMWQRRLDEGKVRVDEREQMQKEIQRIRDDLGRAKTGKSVDVP